MKRTTIFIPETLERRLQQFAVREDKSVAAVVREALASHLDAKLAPFALPPTFDSGRSDVASRFDELLFQDFDVHAGARPARAPGKKGKKR
jgi:hypothetical protein